jgi:Asp-tRNA(Asn)/Glu-tRNA(Gln) amidotransferase B subunit
MDAGGNEGREGVGAPVQVAANLILNELMPRLKKAGIEIQDCPIPPEILGIAAKLKHEGKLTTHEIRQWMDEFIYPAG